MDHIIRRLQLPRGAHILDLGCGPGRHTLELARRGFRVVGVDRTSKDLERARANAAKAGLPVEFVQEDMRRFRQSEGFDAAINMLSSFGYFQDPGDDHRVLDNLYASLKPGGPLLMDLMGKEILARIYQEKDWRQRLDGTLQLEERKILDGWDSMENRYVFINGAKRQEFTTRLRLYSGTELAALLRQAGFTSIVLYGGLDGSPYDQAAKRLVITAWK